MNKRIIKVIACTAAAFSLMVNSIYADYSWAEPYMQFCESRGIIAGDEYGNLIPQNNLTREQMAKMLLTAFSVPVNNIKDAGYVDVAYDSWSYGYISKYSEYLNNKDIYFKPYENVTREEFFTMAMTVSCFSKMKASNPMSIRNNFADWNLVDEKNMNTLAIAYEKGIISGNGKKLRPDDFLTRAEACKVLNDILYELENTYLIIGNSEVTLETAKKWAEQRGAAQRFIDIADTYWYYGQLMGIRADVVYAQAAKETNFGKYTGIVQPEQNNWAGIKKYGAVGDAMEDHEDFLTPDDGVRGHFNHLGAYIGIAPIGEPHGRYKSAKSLAWAGSVRTVYQLGGKWCPDRSYGHSIIRDFLEPMKATK